MPSFLLSWIVSSFLSLTTWPSFFLVLKCYPRKKIISRLLARAKQFIWNLLMMYFVAFRWTLTTFLLTLFIWIKLAIENVNIGVVKQSFFSSSQWVVKNFIVLLSHLLSCFYEIESNRSTTARLAQQVLVLG